MAFGDRLKAATPNSSMDLTELKKKKLKKLHTWPHIYTLTLLYAFCVLHWKGGFDLLSHRSSFNCFLALWWISAQQLL